MREKKGERESPTSRALSEGYNKRFLPAINSTGAPLYVAQYAVNKIKGSLFFCGNNFPPDVTTTMSCTKR